MVSFPLVLTKNLAENPYGCSVWSQYGYRLMWLILNAFCFHLAPNVLHNCIVQIKLGWYLHEVQPSQPYNNKQIAMQGNSNPCLFVLTFNRHYFEDVCKYTTHTPYLTVACL